MSSIALLVFPGVQALDVFGPSDVFSEANRFLAADSHYHVELIATEPGVVSCSSGLKIQPDRHFSEVADSHDLLLVAGGPSLAQQPLDAPVHAWLQQASRRARRFGAICNGTLTLARAGLLEHRSVTTHWSDAAALAALCPTAHVDASHLFMQDRELFTSAGVTAGIDLSLHLLRHDHGTEIALNVARQMVTSLQRTGGQTQFSAVLAPAAEASSPVAVVRQYVHDHLADDLSVATLAAVAKMSTRHFSRVFVRDTRVTPAEFVERARIDAARAMLENSPTPLKSIACRCGLRDAHQLRAAFRRRLGITPQQYRLHFGAQLIVDSESSLI
jgi:transcriptional regulator GlxA family with amidase domain